MLTYLKLRSALAVQHVAFQDNVTTSSLLYMRYYRCRVSNLKHIPVPTVLVTAASNNRMKVSFKTYTRAHAHS